VNQVAALKGGWSAWLQAGYPITAAQAPGSTPTATTGAEGGAGVEPGVLGNADAPVTIVEYSDYQCPYCRRHVQQTVPQLKEIYIDTGKARYVFKDFPLESHPNAQKAAEAARCAGAQGAFWSMHDRLFESQSEWAGQDQQQVLDTFVSYAQDLGLDTHSFGECLTSEQFAAQIAQDIKEGQQAGIQGTPSFLINGQLLPGAYSFDRFQQMIEAALGIKP
jgi:protein-disulfide isomerase